MRSTTSEMNAPSSYFDEKQGVESLEPDCLNCEEIAGQYLIFVVTDEGSLRHPLFIAFWGWWDTVAVHHMLHCHRTNGEAQFLQLSFQFLVPQPWIFFCQSDYPVFQLGINGWSSGFLSLPIGPFPPHGFSCQVISVAGRNSKAVASSFSLAC